MKNLFFLLFLFSAVLVHAQTYTVPGAQIQPAWVFPLWFEDGNGERDTAYLCYDSTAHNQGIGNDTVFGEYFLESDSTDFFISLSCICPPYDTLAINTIVTSGLPSIQLNIWKAKLPLRITWDKNLFFDTTLLSIPIPDTRPNPLFEVLMWCSDFDPDYTNCGVNYPVFWVPVDNIGCCPDPYGLGIKTDCMIFYGDTTGPFSVLNNTIGLNFQSYAPWVGVQEVESLDVAVFPNPFLEELTIQSNTVELRQAFVQSVDGSGYRVSD